MFFRAVRISLSIAGLTFGASHFAASAEVGEQLKVRVKYDEAALNTHDGAQAVYGKLRAAARRVCVPFEGRELSQLAAWQGCYNTALENAVIQVNREAVTALHQHATHAERSS